MIIQLHQIGKEKSRFEFDLSQKQVEELEDRFQFSQMHCVAELKQNMDSLFLSGDLSVDLETNCDCCLTGVILPVETSFEVKLLAEQSQTQQSNDSEVSLQGIDVETYNGFEVDLGKLFGDQLLLEIPFSIKCKDSCKGICSHCGKNLNQNQCNCQAENSDSPFAILKQLDP